MKPNGNGKPVKRDQRGRIVAGSAALNPAGRPVEGESWAALIHEIGNLTPVQAGEYAGELGRRIAKYGDNLSLKRLVVIRIYEALLFEPQPGLLNAFMDRVEGKVTDRLEHSGAFTVYVEAAKWEPN